MLQRSISSNFRKNAFSYDPDVLPYISDNLDTSIMKPI